MRAKSREKGRSVKHKKSSCVKERIYTREIDTKVERRDTKVLFGVVADRARGWIVGKWWRYKLEVEKQRWKDGFQWMLWTIRWNTFKWLEDKMLPIELTIIVQGVIYVIKVVIRVLCRISFLGEDNCSWILVWITLGMFINCRGPEANFVVAVILPAATSGLSSQGPAANCSEFAILWVGCFYYVRSLRIQACNVPVFVVGHCDFALSDGSFS